MALDDVVPQPESLVELIRFQAPPGFNTLSDPGGLRLLRCAETGEGFLIPLFVAALAMLPEGGVERIDFLVEGVVGIDGSWIRELENADVHHAAALSFDVEFHHGSWSAK